jgi:hypothetical protein
MLSIEQEFLSLVSQLKLTLPKVIEIPLKKQKSGSFIYNQLDKQIYFSDGTSWILLTSEITYIMRDNGYIFD